jgi:NAD(P)H-dependent FMN reductase
MEILAISGSLRSESSNTRVLRALSLLGESTRISLYGGLDSLPYFNPDLDSEGATPPESVANLRSLIGRCDGILISSPEYAHGVPGVLKNALDWLVSAPELYGKPVGLVNISPRSTYAHESLSEILRTMSVNLVAASELTTTVPKGVTAEEMVQDPEISRHLRLALQTFVAKVRERSSQIPT